MSSKMFDYGKAIEPSRLYYKKKYKIDYYEYEKLQIISFYKAYTDCDKVICDIGCGYYQYLMEKPMKNNYIGVDIDFMTLKKNTCYDMKVCADCMILPFRTASVDVASAFYLIEHLESPANAFNELSRILKKNGKLIITVPNRNSILGFFAVLLPSKVQNLLWRVIKGSPQPFKVYYRLNTITQIRAVIDRNKLRIALLKLLEGPPIFLARFRLLFKIMLRYQSIMNRFGALKAFRNIIFVIAEKRHDG